MKLLLTALLFAFVVAVIAPPPPPPSGSPPSGSPPPPPSGRPPRPPPGKRCDTADDCEADECCVMRNFWRGECKPRGKENDHCSDDKLVIGRHMGHCPCQEGLTCEPEEVKDLPFGLQIKINERCIVGGTEADVVTTAAPDVE